jgi:hypothetical protein
MRRSRRSRRTCSTISACDGAVMLMAEQAGLIEGKGEAGGKHLGGKGDVDQGPRDNTGTTVVKKLGVDGLGAGVNNNKNNNNNNNNLEKPGESWRENAFGLKRYSKSAPVHEWAGAGGRVTCAASTPALCSKPETCDHW